MKEKIKVEVLTHCADEKLDYLVNRIIENLNKPENEPFVFENNGYTDLLDEERWGNCHEEKGISFVIEVKDHSDFTNEVLISDRKTLRSNIFPISKIMEVLKGDDLQPFPTKTQKTS
jgi:hypothetical protein